MAASSGGANARLLGKLFTDLLIPRGVILKPAIRSQAQRALHVWKRQQTGSTSHAVFKSPSASTSSHRPGQRYVYGRHGPPDAHRISSVTPIRRPASTKAKTWIGRKISIGGSQKSSLVPSRSSSTVNRSHVPPNAFSSRLFSTSPTSSGPAHAHSMLALRAGGLGRFISSLLSRVRGKTSQRPLSRLLEEIQSRLGQETPASAYEYLPVRHGQGRGRFPQQRRSLTTLSSTGQSKVTTSSVVRCIGRYEGGPKNSLGLGKQLLEKTFNKSSAASDKWAKWGLVGGLMFIAPDNDSPSGKEVSSEAQFIKENVCSVPVGMQSFATKVLAAREKENKSGFHFDLDTRSKIANAYRASTIRKALNRADREHGGTSRIHVRMQPASTHTSRTSKEKDTPEAITPYCSSATTPVRTCKAELFDRYFPPPDPALSVAQSPQPFPSGILARPRWEPGITTYLCIPLESSLAHLFSLGVEKEVVEDHEPIPVMDLMGALRELRDTLDTHSRRHILPLLQRLTLTGHLALDVESWLQRPPHGSVEIMNDTAGRPEALRVRLPGISTDSLRDVLGAADINSSFYHAYSVYHETSSSYGTSSPAYTETDVSDLDSIDSLLDSSSYDFPPPDGPTFEIDETHAWQMPVLDLHPIEVTDDTAFSDFDVEDGWLDQSLDSSVSLDSSIWAESSDCRRQL